MSPANNANLGRVYFVLLQAVCLALFLLVAFRGSGLSGEKSSVCLSFRVSIQFEFDILSAVCPWLEKRFLFYFVLLFFCGDNSKTFVSISEERKNNQIAGQKKISLYYIMF